MNVILLHNNQRNASTTHVAIPRVVREKVQIVSFLNAEWFWHIVIVFVFLFNHAEDGYMSGQNMLVITV
jgi:hypothetical protein